MTRQLLKGCILPGGNRREFPKLDAELKRRGVRHIVIPIKAGGRVYLVDRRDLRKLPHDHGAYLGDDNSGHALSEMNGAFLDSLASL